MQFDGACDRLAVVFRDRGIMLSRRIHVAVTENIRNNIDISRLTIERRAVGRAEFVRRDLFERGNDPGIFFHEIFHGAHGNAAILQ